MGKRTWYVFTIKDRHGGFYSYADSFCNNQNLVDIAKGAETMNACDSKKVALEIAAFWNEMYIQNGTASELIMPKVA